MSFNNGYLCPNCGPVEKAKERSIRKIKHLTCGNCSAIVSKWTRPMKERIGRCPGCGNGSFTLKLKDHRLIRTCKNPDCGHESDPDQMEG